MPEKPTYEELEQRIRELEIRVREDQNIHELFSSAPNGIFLIDLSGKILFANERGARRLEREPRDIVGTTLTHYFQPDIAERRRLKGIEALKTGEPQHLEDRVGDRWYDSTVLPMEDERGNHTKLAIYSADITDRKKVEEALLKSELWLKSIFNALEEAVLVVTPERKLVNINDAAKKIFGYSHDEIFEISTELFHVDHDHYVEFGRRINAAFAKGEAAHFEFEARRKNGEIFPSEHTVSLLIDPRGEPVGIVSVIRDITERKRAEAELRESEEKYRDLVENINDIVYAMDSEGTLTYMSPGVEGVLGYPQGQMIGKSNLEFICDDQWDEVRENLKKMSTAGSSERHEYRMVSQEGKPVWIRISMVPIYQNGEIAGWRGAFTDVTESKRLQEQLKQAQKMEAIGTLAGGIAHEFNNVLGIILGNAELALDDVPDWNPARDSLEEIRSASLRAKDVVRQILSFARRTMTGLKPIEINTVIRESLKLMRASLPTMIEIRQELSSEPKIILGNPAEISQILMNLCSNAAHSMKEDGGVLEVGIASVTLEKDEAARYEGIGPGDFVKLTVIDSGRGIAPDILNKIFDPYFTTKDVDEGTGMGLAVVYGLVKKCGGAIDIRCPMGRRTVAEVLFPENKEMVPEGVEERERPPTGMERILLVDDEESLVKLNRQRLEQLGYTVVGMTDPLEALEHFRSNPRAFDLVMTDMAMPHMAGDQLAGKLIEIRKDIPILLCTGHSDRIDADKAKQMGIKGFVMKPLDRDGLARTVRGLLDGQDG